MTEGFAQQNQFVMRVSDDQRPNLMYALSIWIHISLFYIDAQLIQIEDNVADLDLPFELGYCFAKNALLQSRRIPTKQEQHGVGWILYLWADYYLFCEKCDEYTYTK